MFWVQAVCYCTKFVSNVRDLFAADDFSRRHFQMHFFLGALRVKMHLVTLAVDARGIPTPKLVQGFNFETL